MLILVVMLTVSMKMRRGIRIAAFQKFCLKIMVQKIMRLVVMTIMIVLFFYLFFIGHGQYGGEQR